MISNLPIYVSITFLVTTVITLLFFIWSIKCSVDKNTRTKALPIFFGLVIWLMVQFILTINKVYATNLNSLPPKIVLFGIMPTIVAMVLVFTTKKGKAFVNSLPLKQLTYLHSIRVLVEIVLYWLFINKLLPIIMTFEGYNFDILAGISAFFIVYLASIKNRISYKVLLFWNIFCLGLLINIIIIAFLAAPTPVQQLGFNQPNIAILYFPFSWLPTFIVPIVLFSHLVAIKQLLKYNTPSAIKQ
jgi:hypothetical protein